MGASGEARDGDAWLWAARGGVGDGDGGAAPLVGGAVGWREGDGDGRRGEDGDRRRDTCGRTGGAPVQ